MLDHEVEVRAAGGLVDVEFEVRPQIQEGVERFLRVRVVVVEDCDDGVLEGEGGRERS